jgi:hypothetical protein
MTVTDPVEERPATGLERDDRRLAVRYGVRHPNIQIAWMREGEREECRGMISDVSVGGALLLTDELPPAGAAMWIRLDALADCDWIEVMGLDARRGVLGPHRVRVAFGNGCPYAVFRTAVWGRLRADFNGASQPVWEPPPAFDRLDRTPSQESSQVKTEQDVAAPIRARFLAQHGNAWRGRERAKQGGADRR